MMSPKISFRIHRKAGLGSKLKTKMRVIAHFEKPRSKEEIKKEEARLPL
jgi:ribosomal protein S21